MIKDNQKYLNKLHVLLDAIIIAVSYTAAWILRIQVLPHEGGVLTESEYFLLLLFLIPAYLVIYSNFNLYTSKRIQEKRVEVLNIVKANAIGIACLMVVLFYLNKGNFSRLLMVLFFTINVLLEIIFRNTVRHLLRGMRRNGFNIKHVLLVGYSRAAEEYIDRIRENPQWGYVVRGILDDNAERGMLYKGIKVIGSIDNLSIILPQNKLDEIAITLSLDEYAKLEEIVYLCEKSGVHTKFIPDYNRIIPTRPYTEDLIGLPVINIRHVPLSNASNMVIKRLIDIAGAVVAIILFSPIMLLTAVLIKLTSKGPVIFSQERVGLHNKPFMMLKFRSMEVQAPSEEKTKFTVPDDPRVTGIGKLIRKTSIDEMPQFFNVLLGDMSLVGPRPERPFFVEKFKEEIPRYMIKHQVRPGLTGWAQVNGYRGNTSIRKRIEYDLYYIENWTVGMDFKILFLTFFKGFINKNAY